MPRRSRADVGLYAPRVTRRADHIPNRGPKTPSAGGGDPYKNWVDLPIDPTNNYWKVIKSGNANTADTTVDLNSDHMRIDFGGSSNTQHRIQGSQNNGVTIVKKTHMNWWAEAGLSVPSGKTAYGLQPEAIQFKIEVLFDQTNGPISTAANGAGPHGSALSVCVGFQAFADDQEGEPTTGGTDTTWGGAYVFKNLNAVTANSTNVNCFKSGYRSYWTNGVNLGGKKFRGQSTSASTDLDAICLATVPLRTSAESSSGKIAFTGGAYSTGDPFGQLYSSSFAFSDTYTQTLQDHYLHPAIWIGAVDTTATRGQVRIKRIRMLIQPINHRAAL
jgi:hypothetical protein